MERWLGRIDGGCLLNGLQKKTGCVNCPVGMRKSRDSSSLFVSLSVIISFYTFLLHLLYWFHKKVIPVMTTYDKPLSKETCLVYHRGSWMIFMRKHGISMRFVLADNQGRALLFGVRIKKKMWGK
jgi:hypothetical protein